jgi:hypothetical protein
MTRMNDPLADPFAQAAYNYACDRAFDTHKWDRERIERIHADQVARADDDYRRRIEAARRAFDLATLPRVIR